MDLSPGVRARTVDTDRLSMHVYEAGPEDGVPVVLLHGNLSTGRFYERVMSGAPDRYRLLAPDLRGFGRTQRVPIDATRGLRDWADDVHALLQALGVEQPPHLLGWSTGGAAVAAYAQDRPVGSLVLVDPVSPYGFGGVRDDGTPCAPDFAGSGAGTANRDYVARLEAGDRSADSPLSPRSVMRMAYWAPDHVLDPAWEDVLVDEVLLTWTGDHGLPRRRRAVAALAGRRAGDARRPQRALARSTATGRASSTSTPSHRSCGCAATATSSSPTARASSSARSAPPGTSPAGRGRTPSRPSRWCARRRRCWTATARRAAGCRWRCSRAPATGRSSTHPTGSGRCCSTSSTAADLQDSAPV